jgi:hypothetical protein
MRLFGVLVVSLFVLTLLFAVAAGAQEESAAEVTTVLAADAADRKVEAETDNVSVKVDNGEVSVSTDDGSSSDDGTSQQSSLTVQQTQTDEGSGSRASTGDVNIIQTSSSSCQNRTQVASLDQDGDGSDTFSTEGKKFRVSYSVNFPSNPNNPTFTISIKNSSGTKVVDDVVEKADVSSDRFIVNRRANNYRLQVTATPANRTTFDVTVDDCRGTDGGGGGHNSANDSFSTSQTDGTETTTDTTATDTTATDTTTSAEAQTAEDQSLQESSNTGNVDRSGDNFRCVDILRIVRNPGRGQYVSSQRFEECLSGDVLANTIPNRRLPGTGGPALLGLAALGLASLVAGASVLRAGMRRRR